MGTRARNAKKDAWEFDPLKDQVIRRHVEPRQTLFDPRDCDDCPVDHKFLSAQRITIAQFKDGTFDADVSWDWSSRDGQRAMKGEWTGMTVFRIPGPNEIDYGVESREIRNALTDSCYVGQGREGSMDIYLIGKRELSKSCFWKIIRRPLESLNQVGHLLLGTLTRHND